MNVSRTDALRWVPAASLSALSDDESIGVVVEGIEVALFRDGDRFFALSDRCTHGDAKLSDGYLEDGCIECPLHQALFDLGTGEVRRGPAVEPVRAFRVQLDGDDIMIGFQNQSPTSRPSLPGEIHEAPESSHR